MAEILQQAQIHDPSHMVINLLSAEQASTAVKFSRADLYLEPFSSTSHSISKEGHPILDGCLGSMSCKLVSKPIPLHDLDYLEATGDAIQLAARGTGQVSELFIAQVVRVESLEASETDEEDPRTLPLLYHRRGYTSCHPTPSKSK
ncbi:hypothetical protein H0H81_008218 [Sphagnurus paluster]|uniref:Flavin reductase like domain-containing protein n=1 Tax=Sphagnurus paluster TaxID=117069 RepID=A0A9P7KKB7_9AGAR|nr:hypothetical protein H0H81_008218 [Sphagnurus paluster]